MATTVAPAQEPAVKAAPLTLTPQAIAKVREIMATQDPLPAGLRIGVVGGGCSGFQYSMAFENQSGMMDKVFSFEDLKVFIDATSLMYLNGCSRLQIREPPGKVHLRLRFFLQRLNSLITSRQEACPRLRDRPFAYLGCLRVERKSVAPTAGVTSV
jgi:iron-sulfur cluster assembly accessory protein